MSVDERTLIERLSSAAPVLADVVAKIAADWAPREPPVTVTMSAIGRALVENSSALLDGELRAVFEVVESALIRGTESEKDSVATGLLEAVLGAGDLNPSRGARVLGFAGREARAFCKAWNEFTGGNGG